MEENIKTQVKIAGRVYPIFVSKSEESFIKELETQINTVYHEMQFKYALTDKLDCLAMTMLHLLTNKSAKTVENTDDSDINQVIDLIEASLTKNLHS
jgi:hypothetical protein